MSYNKIRLVETNFSFTAFGNLSDKEKLNVSETAQTLFSFFNQFAMLHKVKNTMKLHLVKDPVQNIESDYCSFNCFRQNINMALDFEQVNVG